MKSASSYRSFWGPRAWVKSMAARNLSAQLLLQVASYVLDWHPTFKTHAQFNYFGIRFKRPLIFFDTHVGAIAEKQNRISRVIEIGHHNLNEAGGIVQIEIIATMSSIIEIFG